MYRWLPLQGWTLVHRPTQFICISDVHQYKRHSTAECHLYLYLHLYVYFCWTTRPFFKSMSRQISRPAGRLYQETKDSCQILSAGVWNPRRGGRRRFMGHQHWGKKGEKEAAWSDCVWWAGIVVNTEHRILFLSLALPGSLYAMIQPDMDIFEIFTRPCARQCRNSQWLLKITSMYNCTWSGNCNSTLKEELSSV